MRYIKIIISGLFLAGLIGGYLLLRKNKKDENSFIVGTATGYAPFASVNAQGEYEGFDIDVADALAHQMGKTLVIRDLGSMTSLFMALQQGSIDVIIWGLSITQERRNKIAMVRYQGDITKSYPLIFWQTTPADVKSIEDMKNKTVCVEPNSAQDTVLSKYLSIKKMPTEKVDDALLNIQYGKADAALVEPAIAKKFKKKYPHIQELEVPLEQEDQVFGIGIAIKPDNKKLIEQVEAAVQQLQAAGVIQQLENKWDIT